jgi:hypothetical protein
MRTGASNSNNKYLLQNELHTLMSNDLTIPNLGLSGWKLQNVA